MKLYLQNKNEEIELPRDFIPSYPPVKRRTSIKQRLGNDGSFNAADGMIETGRITFDYMQTSGDIPDIITEGKQTNNDAEQTKDNSYKIFIRKLVGFFRPEYEPFYLIDRDSKFGAGARCEIAYSTHKDKPAGPGLTLRVGKNDLELEQLSIWEDEIENLVYDTDGVVNNSTIYVTNNSELPTKFKVVFDALAPVETIKITNQTNNQSFEFSHIGFGPGSQLVIDGTGKEGIVTLDGVDATTATLDGSNFIDLEPGVNTLLIVMAAGSSEFFLYYRQRYVI